MSRTRNVFWLVTLLLAGCGVVTPTKPVAPTPAPPASPTAVANRVEPTATLAPTNSPTATLACNHIAFSMLDIEGGFSDLYSVCPDGSGLKQLTRNVSYNDSPAWSPDGTRLAFSSSRSGTKQIYVMNADGSNPEQVTFDYENTRPIWLPGGEVLAFLTTDNQGLWWWRKTPRDGQGLQQLTEASYDHFYQTPAWSPDGTKLAYMSLEEQKARNDGSSQIHVKDVNGTTDYALTADIWANVSPVWSPDGSQLAFFSERDGTYNSFALYVIGVGGTNLRRLTEPVFGEGATSSWSPDGQHIVIGENTFGRLLIVGVETGEKTELLQLKEGLFAFTPAWQP